FSVVDMNISESVNSSQNTESEPQWGPWSAWDTTPRIGSDNCQVETATWYVYYHYILQYPNGNCGAYPVDYKLFNSQKLKYTSGTDKGKYITIDSSAQDYHEYICETPLEKLNNGRLTYYDYDKDIRLYFDKYENVHCKEDYTYSGNANYLYYKGTITVYRSRTKE
ncbi:MAG: hypothetical protein ACI4RV_09085, partial [Eubacteriales bacterium]